MGSKASRSRSSGGLPALDQRAIKQDDPLEKAQRNARNDLINELDSVIAQTLLDQSTIDLSSGAVLLNLTNVSDHVVDCFRKMSSKACDALKRYAEATLDGPIEKVIFNPEFTPALLMLQQLKLLGVHTVVDSDLMGLFFDLDIESRERAMDVNDEVQLRAWESVANHRKGRPLVEYREHSDTKQPIDAKRDASISGDAVLPGPQVAPAAQPPQEELSLPAQTLRFRRGMFFCCQAKPGSPVSPGELTLYDNMCHHVGKIMSLPTMLEQREGFFRFEPTDGDSPTALDYALANNPWAAAAIVLGFLESDAPLYHKAILLGPAKGNDVQLVLDALGMVQDPQDQNQAQFAIKRIQDAWAPAKHLLRLTRDDNQRVTLRNPSPRHSRNCSQAELTIRCMASDAGMWMLCSAKWAFPDLAKYAHDFKDNKCWYRIPTDDLIPADD